MNGSILARSASLALAAMASLLLVPAAVAAPGELDPSFGAGGIFTGPPQFSTTPYAGTHEHVAAVGSQRRVVVAATRVDATGKHLAVFRLTPAGTLDQSFNSGGATRGV